MRNFEDLYKKQENVDAELDTDNGSFKVYEKDQIKQFLICIAKGNTFDTSCGFAKLLVRDVKEWLAQGDDDAHNYKDTKYADFYYRYKKAEAIFEINMNNAIDIQIQNGDASKAMWKLERRKPESYSPKQEVKVGSENLQIKVDIPKA